MLKKLVLGTLVFGLMSGVVSADNYVSQFEFNKLANDVYDLHNDQLLLHLQQQKELEQIKKGMQDINNLQYDDTNIVKQIDTIKESQDKLQGQVKNNTTLLNSVQGQLQEFKGETRKGIAGAVAIAGLEKPPYNPNKKASVMIGTGTYKGHTAVAY